MLNGHRTGPDRTPLNAVNDVTLKCPWHLSKKSSMDCTQAVTADC